MSDIRPTIYRIQEAGRGRELFLVFNPHRSFSTVVFVPVGASSQKLLDAGAKLNYF